MNHERENLEEKYPTHPAILAFFVVFEREINEQIRGLIVDGVLTDKGVIYQRKPDKDKPKDKIE